MILKEAANNTLLSGLIEMLENNGMDDIDLSEINLDQTDDEKIFPGRPGKIAGELADEYALELRKKSDANKIQPLKKLSSIGSLKHLKFILPLYQYSSDFIRKMARNTAIKIILRSLRESEESADFNVEHKIKYIDLLVKLDNRYSYLKKIKLDDSKISRIIFDMLSQENQEFKAQKLAEVINDSDERVRAIAVKVIAEMLNQTETSLLVKLLRDPDARVRANVIEALESIGDPNVIGILMRYKTDRNDRVRANAIKALWNLGYREIESSLREMLLNSDTKMHSSAIWVIGEIGHNQPKLKELLKTAEHGGDDQVLEIVRTRKKIAWREKGLRVLVIDNDREFLRELFRKMARDGIHIIAAFDGKAGVEAAIRQKPDFVVLDLNIPQFNGLSVLKKLKNEEATRNIPIVVTCQSDNKAGDIGTNKYLIKPFDYKELREILCDNSFN